GGEGLGARGLAGAVADEEVGAAGEGSPPRRGRRQRVVDRRSGRERARHELASHTRSGVIGSCLPRAPTTLAIAFAIAPAVGTHGGSPTPFDPFGPAFRVSVSTQAMSIWGASAGVTSL